MTTAKQKLVDCYGIDKSIDNTGFIYPDGTYTILWAGVEHATACKNAGTSLRQFLNQGGLRLNISCEHIAVESEKQLTQEQIYRLQMIIRKNNFAMIVVTIDSKHSIESDFKRITNRHLNIVLEDVK